METSPYKTDFKERTSLGYGGYFYPLRSQKMHVAFHQVRRSLLEKYTQILKVYIYLSFSIAKVTENGRESSQVVKTGNWAFWTKVCHFWKPF